MPDVMSATYRIVTPMFIGGADQTPTDGVRPPSVKGALRFWWRALQWGPCLREAGNEDAALRALHQKEGALFGIAADDGERGRRGQGRFMLKVRHAGQELQGSKLPAATAGHQYLLGLGLYHFRNQYLRAALEPGELEVRLVFRPNTKICFGQKIAVSQNCAVSNRP